MESRSRSRVRAPHHFHFSEQNPKLALDLPQKGWISNQNSGASQASGSGMGEVKHRELGQVVACKIVSDFAGSLHSQGLR